MRLNILRLKHCLSKTSELQNYFFNKTYLFDETLNVRKSQSFINNVIYEVFAPYLKNGFIELKTSNC